MRQLKPIPSYMSLAPTLARRLHQLREFRNMTVKEVSRGSRLTAQRIEDIEAGLETWLSSSDRQLLALSLGVDPLLLQEVESRPVAAHKELDSLMFDQTSSARISEAILNGSRDLECPDCSGILKCSVQQGLDIEGRPIAFAKAFCLKCPFTLR